MENLLLNFELLPSGAWNFNLRTQLSKKAWGFIRNDAYSRANGKCMICGRPVKRLEAHEQWSFDSDKHVQKLENVVAICHACHQVKHIGRTQIIGEENKAINHFKKVNKCDYQVYIKNLALANENNLQLSKIDDWMLDLSWLERFVNDK